MSDDEYRNLLYIGVGRVTDGVILASFDDLLESDQKRHAEDVFSRLLIAARLNLKPRGRERLRWNEGSVCCFLDPQGLCLYALVTSTMSYPEKAAFRLLYQVMAEVTRKHGLLVADLPAYSLNRSLKGRMAELLDHYEEPNSLEAANRLSQENAPNGSSNLEDPTHNEASGAMKSHRVSKTPLETHSTSPLLPNERRPNTKRSRALFLSILLIIVFIGCLIAYWIIRNRTNVNNGLPANGAQQ